jgi:hypothetical protein
MASTRTVPGMTTAHQFPMIRQTMLQTRAGSGDKPVTGSNQSLARENVRTLSVRMRFPRA